MRGRPRKSASERLTETISFRVTAAEHNLFTSMGDGVAFLRRMIRIRQLDTGDVLRARAATLREDGEAKVREAAELEARAVGLDTSNPGLDIGMFETIRSEFMSIGRYNRDHTQQVSWLMGRYDLDKPTAERLLAQFNTQSTGGGEPQP